MLATASMDGRVQVCEEAPVRDVRAGSADRKREPQTTEERTQEPLRDLGPNIITEQEYSFTATAERETVRDVKEKLRFSSLDYDTELHELQEGNTIIVGAKRFRCAEALFQPVSLTTRFHDTFFLSKTKCHVYIRQEQAARPVPK